MFRLFDDATIPTIVTHFDDIYDISNVYFEFIWILWTVIIEYLTSENKIENRKLEMSNIYFCNGRGTSGIVLFCSGSGSCSRSGSSSDSGVICLIA